MSDHRGGDEHTVPYASGFCSAHQNGEDRECGYCYPNKRITEEQVVEVIKWLGIKSGLGKRWFHSNIVDFFVGYIADWLYSAEGQEALIDRLLSPEEGVALTFQYRGTLGYKCTIEQLLTWEMFGETRQHALLLTILEMDK